MILRGSNRLLFFDDAKLDPLVRRRDRAVGLPDAARQLRDREHAAEPVVVSAAVRLGEGLRAGAARPGQSARHALDGDLRSVRRDPRHAGRGVDRLLGLARLHPDAHPRRRVALPATWRSARRSSSSPGSGMARARGSSAQGVAIGLVALLFILLAWSLVSDEGGDLAARCCARRAAAAPGLHARAPRRGGRAAALVARRARRSCSTCGRRGASRARRRRRSSSRCGARTAIVVSSSSASMRRTSAPTRGGSRAASTSRSRSSTTARATRSTSYGVTGFPETFVLDREGPCRRGVRRRGRRRGRARAAPGRDRARARVVSRAVARSRSSRRRARGRGGAASAAPPNAADLEAELVCPVCETTLDQSNAPVAERMKAFIRVRIAAGDSEQEIKDALVAEFGPGVLASRRTAGFGLLAWLLPLARAPRRRGRRSASSIRSLEPAARACRSRTTSRSTRSSSVCVDEELARFDG